MGPVKVLFFFGGGGGGGLHSFARIWYIGIWGGAQRSAPSPISYAYAQEFRSCLNSLFAVTARRHNIQLHFLETGST